MHGNTMRGRRTSEREDRLLDDEDDDVSSSSSEPGNCNWIVLTGIFVVQFVISGLLSSYGVFLIGLDEEVGVSLKDAFWTPAIYTVSWCLADPLCKRVSDKRGGQGSRVLAIIGILMAAGGVATAALTYSPVLQAVGYGLIGGLGSSLVLTQVEVMLHCHYPTQGRLPNCVPQLGNALAHFATPLLLLAFTSAYGSSWAPLLQAGIVMQGILGAATFVAHVKRPPAIARYRVRPRAFTVLNGDGESQSILARDSYINASFSGANSPSSNRTWRSLSPTTEEPEFIVSSGNTPLTHEMNYRCNKNQFGVDILPEIPEESEDDVESDYNTKIEVHEVPQTGNSDINVNEVPQTTHTRSLDNYLDTNKMYPNSIEDGVENKRWSIGTVEEILPMCVENGLSLLVSKNEGKSDAFNSHQKSNENISQKIKEEGKVSDLSIKSEVRQRANTMPSYSPPWTTKASGEISPFDTKDTREFDPILSNSIDIPSVHVIRNSGSDFRKVKSLDEVPLFDKENLTNQEDILKKDIIVTSGDGGSRYLSDDNLSSNDQVGSIMKEINTFRSLELPDEVKNRLKRWSIGTLGEVKSENDRSNLGKLEGLESNGHRKWRSAEFGENREPKDQFSDKLSQTRVFTFEIDDSIANRNNVVLGEYQGADNVGSSSSGSGDSEHPLWVAKLVSSENMTVESTSGSNEENSSLRNWYRRPSTLSHALRRLRFSCTCQFYRRHSFRRRYPRNRFASILLYYFLEPLSVPYFFPSLLLRFALRLCPMGFAALAPSLTKDIIPEITNEEAVFSVSISGFVWLCFLLVTPWCTRMHHSRKKYLFAAGSLVSSYGLHLLSKAETHDRVTLSCAVFGLGQGATMVTGNNMVREVLGTWNLAKADVFLDLTSGVLVLGASSIMDLILKDRSGLPACFTLMAVVYLVTGVVWLLRPLLASVRCQHHPHTEWSTSGGHILTSG